MENLELWKNIGISLFVAFSGTILGGYLIRLALRKVYNLAVSKIAIAEQKNLISAETADKATHIVTNGINALETKIGTLETRITLQNNKLDELIAYYKKREEQLLELIREEFDVND